MIWMLKLFEIGTKWPVIIDEISRGYAIVGKQTAISKATCRLVRGGFSSWRRVDAYIRETTVHNGITRMQPHDVKSCDTLSRHAQQGYNTVADRTLSLSLSFSHHFFFSPSFAFFSFVFPFVLAHLYERSQFQLLQCLSVSIFFSLSLLSSSHFGSEWNSVSGNIITYMYNYI